MWFQSNFNSIIVNLISLEVSTKAAIFYVNFSSSIEENVFMYTLEYTNGAVLVAHI